MKQGAVYTLLIIAFLVAVPVSTSAQVLPAEIRRELARNNLTESEARGLAARLGINLDDPVQAAQRARELGV